ncbi:nucleotide-binding protein [Clostridium luticellarii]|jgi:CO dehydrogenase maturation factor|uniref:CobQ/CobB/MinD/ParA nucleotide binding domain protein n=1 Tax=Clostridium luticellarii TaxID=1691940 RepID=A0A2T0BSX1_9CLOT|nr:AAA family ATPase [Clostridium luticellarii]MCI1946188.1 AAA family ATPase [Clostridium luticellarii]MCI1969489.1 AAA family ATPase [Clostridium luticellarii]MCI1995452.1 AAA family ATPase [Clostridium luticellarii]MCI2040636.1 AAA family ATPase [Clostridium luticellarii]PRR86969.1 CobQ/CobB/MinD/ParA nucleotide binding domain protein [Clostridium luticellarii]
MGYKIAVAGKGGTGKTTLTGLLIDYLIKKGAGPILAVDADANSNLNEVLGTEIEETIGEIREDVSQRSLSGDNFPGGMRKAEYLKYKLNASVTEGDGYDLIVMGRSQGPGCYCYVNGILKAQVDSLSSNYDYIVVDNEAGMEHLSRKLIEPIDTLFLISDCSRRGVQAVGRIKQLVSELNLKVGQIFLIVNRAPEGKLNAGINEEIEKQGLNLIGVVPMDQMVYDYDSDGKALVNLPDNSVCRSALNKILSKIQFKSK